MTELRNAALLLICVAFLSACGGPQEDRGRVLLIGIDGASMRAINPLMADGRLPNLQRIAQSGVSGPLRSSRPLLSPRIWTSIATGKRPNAHGILAWVRQDEVGDVRLYDSHDRQTWALWNIASSAGLRVAVVNWLMTYPPEPIDGVMVSDYALPEEMEGKRDLAKGFADAWDKPLAEPRKVDATAVYPEEWTPRALAERHAQARLTDMPNLLAALEGSPTWERFAPLSNQARRDEQLTSIALEIEAELHPDVLMVLLQGIDRISHFLWRTLEEPQSYPADFQEPRAERLRGREALLGFYVFTDALIGRLVERYDEDDLVIVLSDHGFEAGERFPAGEHVTKAARDGVIFARGTGIVPGAPTRRATFLDVTPTILAWLGLPAGADMNGVAAAFLDRDPPPPIASYDAEPIPRLAWQASGAEEDRLEDLRSLGYIE